ncbi:hypothetical protein [Iamia sp.]|uniref:hypothetical protein n=1 Tax=Iamia sp. TaxID=2722710 RepID=UPI002B5721E6|nr:hypothetical protein [Iamia sp.]HXH56371.1 hypothetical protein [Iamia sp.]
MLVRRCLSLVAGLALVVVALVRREGGGDGDGPSQYDRGERAAVTALQRASPEALDRLAEEGSGYDLAFRPRFEEAPTLVCASELAEACRRLGRLGFEVLDQEGWTTLARLRDSEDVDIDAWVGPEALLTLGVAASEGDLELGSAPLADSLVAAVSRPGPGPSATCRSSATPLTCLVGAAERLTVADPGTSAAGAAVVIALARESGGSGPDDLAAAAELLADAQVTAAPVTELLAVGAPAGEVALGTDAAVGAAFGFGRTEDGDEPEPPSVEVRWSRTSDSVPLAVAVDPDDRRSDRIVALFRSRAAGFSFEQNGYLALDDTLYVDDDGPLADRPGAPAPVAAADLEAAHQAWQERDR